jgi:two-component system chemotaxis sensor kinase CheA
MNMEEEQFLKSLRATFNVEANEHLEAIAVGLLELERASATDQQRIIETVFRAAHSLKGAARAVNFTEIESVCQSLEDVFATWKRRDNTPSAHALDTLHLALGAVSNVIANPQAKADPELSYHVRALRELSMKATAFPAGEDGDAQPDSPDASSPHPPPGDKTAAVDTVRITVAKLDERLLEAEEMLAAKLITSQRASDLRKFSDQLGEWKQHWAKVEPQAHALRSALERSASAHKTASHPAIKTLVEFFDWNNDYFRSLEGKLAALKRTAAQDSLVVDKLVDDLLENSKKLLMLPLSRLAGLLQKLVRDLCRDQDKEADLVISGEEIEIHKRILEEMKDPLIHIIRNCVDHGLETAEQRLRQGKPGRATITIAMSPLNGDKVELVITDDGMGIDIARVEESAVKRGLISSEDASQLSESEALALIFRTDVSTSPIITHLSGRGLGLAIVREKTEKLGGQVSVESSPGVGTTIRITLPIALRTFRGILVEVAKQMFVVPTAQVKRVTRFKPDDVQTVEGRETLALNGRAVALTRLAEVLELSPVEQNGNGSEVMPAIILGAAEQQVAFAVDAILGEQEVITKPLKKPLSRVRNIAGATVLGSGQVAPILNVNDLLQSAKLISSAPTRVAATHRAAEELTKSILVVEDSITSRMLLKGILESAGYQVKTAVDGVDAFTALRAEHFDLVVSDIEMPRLNGFGLTAKIRADKRLSELPVVLVTALETREDREHGIDAGANAYLIKSSFDQSNLLEAVRRLL